MDLKIRNYACQVKSFRHELDYWIGKIHEVQSEEHFTQEIKDDLINTILSNIKSNFENILGGR